MKFKNTIVFAALLAMGVSTFAADEIAAAKKEKDHGIRITGGVGPGVTETEALGTTIDVEDDMGGQLEVLYARRHWQDGKDFAWIWGGGLFFAGNSGNDNDPVDPWDYDLAAFGVMGQGGIAYRIGDVVILEAQPYLGFGGAAFEATETGTGLLVLDGTTSYFMYGIKGGAFVALGKRIELGVEVGYQGFGAETEIEGSGIDLNLSGSGLHASGVVAIKF